MVVVFMLFYHRIMFLRLLVMKDVYIREAMDTMIENMQQFEYRQMADTDLFEQTLAKWMANDEDLYGVFIGIDTLFIDTIIVPLLYDGMIAGLLIRDLLEFGENEMSSFEFIYSIIVCVLVGLSLGCYSCIAIATRVLKININRR